MLFEVTPDFVGCTHSVLDCDSERRVRIPAELWVNPSLLPLWSKYQVSETGLTTILATIKSSIFQQAKVIQSRQLLILPQTEKPFYDFSEFDHLPGFRVGIKVHYLFFTSLSCFYLRTLFQHCDSISFIVLKSQRVGGYQRQYDTSRENWAINFFAPV